MKYRIFGRTGWKVSEIGFGSWAIGADWGTVSEKDALAALHAAADNGVNFFDTADVYGDGRSEQILSTFRKQRKDPIYIVTKAGRRLNPHIAESYTPENIEKFIDRSLKNLQTDSLDLVQLHCPSTPVYYNPDLFEGLEKLVKKGKIKHYGVSVEKVEEAIKAIEYPGLVSVQIIFNIFRQRPAELFFEQAKKKNIAVIVRVPLASGLLSGKITSDRLFPKTDHRNYNRQGQAFDKGETFAGVDFETGLNAVAELKKLIPKGMTMAQFALKWILSHPQVSTVIPGAKNPTQAIENAAASDLSDLTAKQIKEANKIYTTLIKPLVHQRW